MQHNRRHLLKSAAVGAGSVTLAPLMGALLGRVQAQTAEKSQQPLRFLFFLRSSGLWAEMIQPRGLLDRLPYKLDYDDKGDLVVDGKPSNEFRMLPFPAADLPIPGDSELSEVMEPLEPYRDRVSILQGINSGFNVYHQGHYQTLGGFAARIFDTTDVFGPTVDSLLARALTAPVPHLCLGQDFRSPSGVSYLPMSAEGAGKPIAFYTKPKRAYKELFGVTDSGAARQAYDVQSNILDFFVEDAKRLRGEVAGPEREQLDRYLNSFESLRYSRQQVEAMGDRLRKYAPTPPEEISVGDPVLIGSGHTEIAIAAMLSGLTNVVSMRLDLLDSEYGGIGNMHSGVGHGQVKNILEARRKICRLHFTQIAKIAAALHAVPEGDGTMLDNTMMVYMSENGETHHSSGVNFSIMMLGDMGARLKRHHYFAPGNAENINRSKPGYTRLGDVWATLLAAAGQPYKEFGHPINGEAHRPIEALLA